MMREAIDILTGIIVLWGAFFSLAAAVGLLRLPDLLSRMHAASKAGAVGAGLLLVAAGLHSGDAALALRALAGFLFLVLTSPVSAHLLARASIITGNKLDINRSRNRGGVDQ